MGKEKAGRFLLRHRVEPRQAAAKPTYVGRESTSGLLSFTLNVSVLLLSPKADTNVPRRTGGWIDL